MGVQQSLKERLIIRVYHLVKKNPSAIRDHLIHVKVTGNGTRISNSMHTVSLLSKKRKS